MIRARRAEWVNGMDQTIPLAAVSCNPDKNVLQALLPLFDQGIIDALEWSFDARPVSMLPGWFVELLNTFGKSGRLAGHGVYYSIFTGKWLPEQQEWLHRLQEMSRVFSFDQVTEHFGFMTGSDFHRGAPLSVPFSGQTLLLGIDRLKRLQEACNCPVGLENLAFAFTLDDVRRHAEFLERLVEPVNGFLILDLHNLYCQSENFGCTGEALLDSWPLSRVREIHISGGSWVPSQAQKNKRIRRDTHDNAVPDEVFALLTTVLPRCPNLKYIVLEQLGTALVTAAQQEQFRRDFLRMRSLTEKQRMCPVNHFQPSAVTLPENVPEDPVLYAQQLELSEILESAADFSTVKSRLSGSSLKNTSWNIERWQPEMLETAMQVARKWKGGWEGIN